MGTLEVTTAIEEKCFISDIMNKNIQLLFDNLRDGLLIISSNNYQIIYANPVAKKITKTESGTTVPDWLKAQLTLIQEGFVALPFMFEITLNDPDGESHFSHVRILNSPVATEYIVTLSSANAAENNNLSLSNMAEILDCEFSSPMKNFLRAVDEMQGQLNDLPQESLKVFSAIQSVYKNAETLKDSFSQICLMSQAFKYNPIRADDRISLSSLIDNVLKNVGKLLVSRHVRVSFSGISSSLPVVYGSEALLIQALSGYVRYLVKEVDSGVHLLFSVRTNGYFVLLTLNNFGRISPTDKSGRKLPYLLGKPVSLENDHIQLSLPMCKRVIELCGGNLRLEKSDGLLTSITLELPIGSPPNQDEEYILQAQRYAEDLVNLMKQKNIQQTEA